MAEERVTAVIYMGREGDGPIDVTREMRKLANRLSNVSRKIDSELIDLDALMDLLRGENVVQFALLLVTVASTIKTAPIPIDDPETLTKLFVSSLRHCEL